MLGSIIRSTIGVIIAVLVMLGFIYLLFADVRQEDTSKQLISSYDSQCSYDMVVELYKDGEKINEWITCGIVSKNMDGYINFIDKSTMEPVSLKECVVISFRDRK